MKNINKIINGLLTMIIPVTDQYLVYYMYALTGIITIIWGLSIIFATSNKFRDSIHDLIAKSKKRSHIIKQKL